MGDAEHSSSSIESERLPKSFPRTTYALEVVNAIPAAAAQHSYNSETLQIPWRDPTAAEIKRFGGPNLAKERIRMDSLKRRMAKEGWGQAARDYVFEPPRVQEKDARFVQATALRALLTSIAEQNETRGKGHGDDIVLWLPVAISILTSLTISGKQCRIEPEEGLFKEILDEGQLGRIKRCAYEKCQRFFWAARVDRPCCQESCRNAYRQKRHREREKQNRQTRKRKKRI